LEQAVEDDVADNGDEDDEEENDREELSSEPWKTSMLM